MSTTTRRNVPQPAAAEIAVLQWANGKTTARTSGGRFGPLVGWHIEIGRDADLDRHCHELGIARIEIKHQRQGGSEIKAHWSLGESVTVWPLTYGPTVDRFGPAAGRAQAAQAQAGIVADWPDGDKSYLAVRVLADIGGAIYAEPLLLSAAGTMTDHVWATLCAHSVACVAADASVGYEVMPWQLGLILGPGAEYAAGKGDKSTDVTAVAAQPADASTLLADDWAAYAGGLAETSPAWASATLAGRAEKRRQTAA
jgi:hypothetical protein